MEKKLDEILELLRGISDRIDELCPAPEKELGLDERGLGESLGEYYDYEPSPF